MLKALLLRLKHPRDVGASCKPLHFIAPVDLSANVTAITAISSFGLVGD